MIPLAARDISVCKTTSASVSEEEAIGFLQEISQWSIVKVDNINTLKRELALKDFNDALNFANHIGELAEQANHHPSITIEWGKVTVSWWTHTIKGLHINDFIMAARSDDVFELMQQSDDQ
ncbi:4a-hydroxytetrahydrobiopterin dehydratase [Gammaproteobacteria bacterium]|nr:4a-hydroxytetrahydrobiopterin dehydratase [Gammaproteobacteria bacterium]